MTDVLAVGEFSVLADGSRDEGDRSQMAVFIRFVNVTSHKVQERFFGVVNFAKSKKAEDLHDIFMKMGAKGLDSSLIRFSGLDGTNAMSGEHKDLQWLIWHTSPFAQYLNCKNHILALCLVHLIPKYQKLTELDGVATGFKTVKNHKGMHYEMAYSWRVLHTSYRKFQTSS